LSIDKITVKLKENKKIKLYKDRKTPKRLQQSIKEQGWLRMEKIDTDLKTTKLKSLAKLFTV